jgi:aspartate racemase
MKTIGLLGGMSWESTETYYRVINEYVKEKLGGLHSARLCLFSLDFDEIEKLQHRNEWAATGKILTDAAKRLEAAGADFLVICTNTMHKMAPAIESQINIPLLHIADATAEEVIKMGLTKVGLLGTNFTMEQDFYKGRLVERYGLEVLIPEEEDRQIIHRVIFDELCLGEISDKSREAYLKIIDKLVVLGSEAIILGCTEIGLLVHQEHTSTPLLDTSIIHARKAVEVALS